MSSLKHHGINGQKWGVRNGPPYPLDAAGKGKVRAQRKEKPESKVSIVTMDFGEDFIDVLRDLSMHPIVEYDPKMHNYMLEVNRINQIHHM